MRFSLPKLVFISSLGVAFASAHADINLISGNGSGSQDSMITALAGSYQGSFETLTTSDFAAATSASNAYIFSNTAWGWAPNLGDGSGAKWIGVDQYGFGSNSHSALYAMNFNVAQTISNAQLNLTFTVDDSLGDANNQGVFLDGKALANSSSNIDWDNTIENKTFGLGTLSAGTHTLYFDVNNSGGGPSGLMFHGTIGSQAVPEPSSYAVLGLGLVGIFRLRRNRKG